MAKRIILVLTVVLMGWALSVPPCAATMYLVTIPDVRNTPREEAEKILKAKGFQVAFAEGPAEMSTRSAR